MVELLCVDLETFDLRVLGRFDAVLCSGVLYHLTKPWRLFAALAALTDRLFVWTHYWGGTDGLEVRDGLRVKPVREEFVEPVRSAPNRPVVRPGIARRYISGNADLT